LKAKLALKNGVKEEAPAPAADAEAAEPAVQAPPKMSAKKAQQEAAKKQMLLKLQKQKEAEAEKRAWEAEQKRLAAEEKARAEEEARLEAERQAAEAEKRRIEREQLRKEGKLLTAKEKAQQEHFKRMREQLAAQGLLPTDTAEPSDKPESKQRKKNKQMRTKAQIEADRVRQLQEQRENDRQKMLDDALELVRAEEPELVASMEAGDAAVAAMEAELAAVEKQLGELKLASEAVVEAAAEEEEELDDWDAESDGEDDAVAQRKAEMESLAAKSESLTADIAAKRESLVATQEQVQTLQKAKEEGLRREQENARKEAEAAAKEAEQNAENSSAKAQTNLRSPIVVILGHVDSGKTSLLDKIRGSAVAKGEAGGITQQIGATFIPGDNIRDMCEKLPEDKNIASKLKLPGLLCIDTPGHESFSMLRSRGSDICDLAILVVDIQKGLQQQTLESIELLRARKTPFVVAITKVDALYSWNKDEANHWNPIQDSLANSGDMVANEFDKLMKHAIASFAEQRLNACAYWENKDQSKYVSLVPLSSKTGEGIPDLMNLVCDLTQSRMDKRLQKSTGFQCTILEVKNLEGHGTTLDVILVNGTIREGDTIVCAGLSGPVVTQVRALLTPPPMRDQRVKTDYVTQKVVHAAMGFKITAPNLSNVLAGSSMYVCGPRDDIEDLKDLAQEDLQNVLSRLDTERNGVFVHASSLGSLEALLVFLRDNNVPISGFDIGTVHKASITKTSIQLDKKKPEYAILLAFDVKVDPEAQALADKSGVKVFCKDVIYHLHDMCLKHFKEVRDAQKLSAKPVFPCVVKSMGKNFVFHNTDPVVMGLRVVAGALRVGTPLYIPRDNNLQLGRVTSIKRDNVDVQIANKGDEVSVAIDQKDMHHPPVFGRQFDDTHEYVSFMNRTNVDTLREFYADEITDVDNKMMDKFIELKWI
jgi:translation initiation factor 5B